MATIMAAKAAIFKSYLSLSHSSGQKSSKYQFSLKLQHFEILMCFGRHLKNGRHSQIVFRILPNFELKLEIPNIMLVCKFEINWSTNKNLKHLQHISDGRTNTAFPYPPLRFAGAGDKNAYGNEYNIMNDQTNPTGEENNNIQCFTLFLFLLCTDYQSHKLCQKFPSLCNLFLYDLTCKYLLHVEVIIFYEHS